MITRTYLVCLLLLLVGRCWSQTIHILHYTETSGFDHRTRTVSLSMFENFEDVKIVDDSDGSQFDDLNNLLEFDVIVFSNTSGSDLLSTSQRVNFETYIEQGGNLLGIHAASDTYRHSSANGGSTGVWDFYAETLGGSVQQNPNHVRGTPRYNIFQLQSHQSVSGIPDPWSKEEEYYYWENGYLDSDNIVLLEVEKTWGPNGQMNSYDSARAVSWYKELPSGSRIFYTSLGHARSNFTDDTLFQQHIEQALWWCAKRSTSTDLDKIPPSIMIYPNPNSGELFIDLPQGQGKAEILATDGSLLWSGPITRSGILLDGGASNSGLLILRIFFQNKIHVYKLTMLKD